MSDNVTVENNTTESVVDDVNVVSATDNSVSNSVDEPLPEVPKKTAKSVGFLIDIESKALIETFSDLEDFGVDKIMSILPKLMQHVENYKNLHRVLVCVGCKSSGSESKNN